VIWRLVELPQLTGIHHWTDAGVASWYDFAVAIAEEAATVGLLPANIEVLPISTDQYPTPARRPRYSVLDKSSLIALGVRPIHWRATLREVLREIGNA
jgi:dTDP-4-dehydrorhamnose reductase